MNETYSFYPEENSSYIEGRRAKHCHACCAKIRERWHDIHMGELGIKLRICPICIDFLKRRGMKCFIERNRSLAERFSEMAREIIHFAEIVDANADIRIIDRTSDEKV